MKPCKLARDLNIPAHPGCPECNPRLLPYGESSIAKAREVIMTALAVQAASEKFWRPSKSRWPSPSDVYGEGDCTTNAQAVADCSIAPDSVWYARWWQYIRMCLREW